MKNDERRKLEKLLSRKIRSVEDYSNDTPSRKVQGMWGGNIEIDGFEKIAILLDASKGKEFAAYAPAINEISRILHRMGTRQLSKVCIVVWAGDAVLKQIRGFNFSYIKNTFESFSGNKSSACLAQALELCRTKFHKPNVVLILSDFELDDAEKAAEKLSKDMQRRTIYLNTNLTEKYEDVMTRLDNDYKSRLVMTAAPVDIVAEKTAEPSAIL